MKIDKKIIGELTGYLKEFNLSEIEYAEGTTKVKVSRRFGRFSPAHIIPIMPSQGTKKATKGRTSSTTQGANNSTVGVMEPITTASLFVWNCQCRRWNFRTGAS